MKFNEIQCSRLFELMRQELSRSESPQHQWFGEGHFKFEEFTRSQHRCWRSGKTIKHPFALSQLCRCATEASINQNHFRVANCCYMLLSHQRQRPLSSGVKIERRFQLGRVRVESQDSRDGQASRIWITGKWARLQRAFRRA